MSNGAPTKAELLEALRSSGQQALETLRALPAAGWTEGRYENGWNAQEILAHISSIEWAYPKLIDLASGEPPPEKAAPAPQQPSMTPPAGGGTPQILNYNERQVAKRADYTVEQLLAELEANRAATIAAVEAADEALFSVVITSAGGVTGPLSTVMNFVAVEHVKMHVRDIAG
jgi:hypothetical protein